MLGLTIYIRNVFLLFYDEGYAMKYRSETK
jgi:hypothetical protein